jgi:hypothetical protein
MGHSPGFPDKNSSALHRQFEIARIKTGPSKIYLKALFGMVEIE